MQEGQQHNQQQATESQQRLLGTVGEQLRVRDLIARRVDSFIITMFGQSQSSSVNQGPMAQSARQAQQPPKVHDVSNSYMRNLYELFPNVRLHTEMICKAMDLLCEICSHEALSQHFAQCLDEFYQTNSPYDDGRARQQPPATPIPDLGETFLKTPLDFYIVEMKAKMICIFFKFF